MLRFAAVYSQIHEEKSVKLTAATCIAFVPEFHRQTFQVSEETGHLPFFNII
jgi:hypothetical protein